LAREVLILRGKINRQIGFVVDEKVIMPDLYFYRDPQEQEKEEPVEPEQKDQGWSAPAMETGGGSFGAVAHAEPVKLDFDVPLIQDWAAASEWDAAPHQVQEAAPIVQPPQPQPPAPQPQQQEPKQQDEWTSDAGGW
jgi:hypothetical protein